MPGRHTGGMMPRLTVWVCGLWPLTLELEVEVDFAPGTTDKGLRAPVGNRVFEAPLNLGIGGQTPDGLIQIGTEFGNPSL